MTIKFRVWDREEKKMIGEALEIANVGYGDGSLIVNEAARSGNELDWMQFTGMLDRNGKEVYVGDICKTTNPYNGKEVIGTIVFNESLFQFGLDADIDESDYTTDHIQGVTEPPEVIGNIYQNPDLLPTT